MNRIMVQTISKKNHKKSRRAHCFFLDEEVGKRLREFAEKHKCHMNECLEVAIDEFITSRE